MSDVVLTSQWDEESLLLTASPSRQPWAGISEHDAGINWQF